ncbi:TPR domain protein, putative component of TonB system [Enhygromyxa salina]|uniref:TPR domain protein, putative component of TonB system n=1 Tax=Enhygromyxa salina TaxID=215803 RepID=A0A0C1Z9Y4_9BACT|nr:TPR domain protein, putative component of TonB system [Enhygromyxa salina]
MAAVSLAALLLVPAVRHAQADDDQVKRLERLIKHTEQSDPDYPDFLFRLADQYLARKHDLQGQAFALYDKIDAATANGKQGQARALETQQANLFGEARIASETAANIYEDLVDNPAFASYSRLDEALYLYAFELGELGEGQRMRAAYMRLIQDFPRSAFLPHAYLSFAEHYFNEGDLAAAVQFYEKVAQFSGSSVRAYALYKLGWCHLNPIGSAAPDYVASLQSFVATIDATLAAGASSDPQGKHLRREARRDLVRAYVHVGKPGTAWAFLQKVGNGPGDDEQHARDLMLRLAGHYANEGMYGDSTIIYEELKTQFPNDPLTADWQAKVNANTLAK